MKTTTGLRREEVVSSDDEENGKKKKNVFGIEQAFTRSIHIVPLILLHYILEIDFSVT